MTMPTEINGIMALCTPKGLRMLEETDDNMQFATDVKEPVSEGSKDNNY